MGGAGSWAALERPLRLERNPPKAAATPVSGDQAQYTRSIALMLCVHLISPKAHPEVEQNASPENFVRSVYLDPGHTPSVITDTNMELLDMGGKEARNLTAVHVRKS